MEAELLAQKIKVETLAGPGDSLKEAEPKDEKRPPLNLPALNKDSLGAYLAEHNRELRALKAQAEKSDRQLSRSHSGWWPDVELMLREKDDHAGTKTRSWQVGVEIPLWLGAEQRAQISQAKAEATSASIRYEEQLRRLSLEAQSLLAEREQLQKQMGLMENGLVQWSGQNVQSARTAYQTGKIEYANFLALIQSAYETLAKYEDLKVKTLENQERLKLLFGGN
jgi:outer membrane protein TolC